MNKKTRKKILTGMNKKTRKIKLNPIDIHSPVWVIGTFDAKIRLDVITGRGKWNTIELNAGDFISSFIYFPLVILKENYYYNR